MSTVGDVIDRAYRTYLYPPDHRPAQAHLGAALNASAQSVSLTNFVIPEDEELLKVGSVIEVDAELMQVTAYNENTLTCTVIRNVMGTTAATHTEDTPVLLSPPYPRQSVFEAVADNIITLYPRLHQVMTTEVISIGGGVSALNDSLAVEVVEAWVDSHGGTQDIDARIVDYHPQVQGRAVVANLLTGDLWVKYRKRFGDAQSESDTLADLGVEDRWVNIVVIGACADLFAGRDIPASHFEWVKGVLEAENVRVGARSSIAQRLASYREYLLENAKKEMRAEYRAKTHMRPAAQVRVRSPFG